MYGPNTNLVANGSIIYFSECEAQYILSAIRLLLEGRANALDCRREVHDAYNVAVDEGNARMAWGTGAVNTWYRNAHGRIAQNWPFTLLEFWQRTREVDLADYELL
jgi:4-hydroxyacetophenone monooxygenase